MYGSQDSPNTYSEDLIKNKEYFENLRKCYDLDEILQTSKGLVETRDSLQSFKELLNNYHLDKSSQQRAGFAQRILRRTKSSGCFKHNTLKRSLTQMDFKKATSLVSVSLQMSSILSCKICFLFQDKDDDPDPEQQPAVTEPEGKYHVRSESQDENPEAKKEIKGRFWGKMIYNIMRSTTSMIPAVSLLRGMIRTSILVNKARLKLIKTEKKAIRFDSLGMEENQESDSRAEAGSRLQSPEPEFKPRSCKQMKYPEINKVILSGAFINVCKKSLRKSSRDNAQSESSTVTELDTDLEVR